MFHLTATQLFFYGGIAVMVLAVVLALVSIGVFWAGGKRLRAKLEKEYGTKQR